VVADQLKMLCVGCGKMQGEIAVDIDDSFAQQADEVMVRLAARVEPFFDWIYRQLRYPAAPAQDIKSIIYRRKGHRGKPSRDRSINILSARVIFVPFEVIKDCEPLRR
jgi:hypothetical protein